MNRWNNGISSSLLMVCLCIVLQPTAGISADDNVWARDPFAYENKSNASTARADEVSEAVEVTKPEMKVKGIFSDRQGHLIAIIDDKEYAAGDHIGNVLVKNINQFGVVLVEDGITRRIGLFGPNLEWGNDND